MLGRVPWLSLVFLPAALLTKVMRGITHYSLSVARSCHKGNAHANRFITTRVALPQVRAVGCVVAGV